MNKSEHDASSIGGLILWLNLRIQYWCTYLHNDITYCGLLEWIEWINCVVARTKLETTSFGDMIIVSFSLKITLFFILGFFLLDNAEMGDGARSISRSAVLFLFCFSRTARRYTSTSIMHNTTNNFCCSSERGAEAMSKPIASNHGSKGQFWVSHHWLGSFL